jgi:hypothetical protein
VIEEDEMPLVDGAIVNAKVPRLSDPQQNDLLYATQIKGEK